MQAMNRRAALRRFASAFCLSICGSAGIAQDDIRFLNPRLDPDSHYVQLAAERNISIDMRYVDQADTDYLIEPTDAPSLVPNFDKVGGGDYSVLIAVALVTVLLLVFLKFGAGGALFQTDPNATKKSRKRASGWGVNRTDQSAGDIVEMIRAMASRRDALILLLRHCLLQAADETETTFRRADTEREALNRLPRKWRRYTQLANIMQQAELVHYGGRQIADEDFETAVSQGAEILKEGR